MKIGIYNFDLYQASLLSREEFGIVYTFLSKEDEEYCFLEIQKHGKQGNRINQQTERLEYNGSIPKKRSPRLHNLP
jgi:hypothetical protein